MTNKWKCIKKCFVPVGGILRLRRPGDIVSGEISESAQKFFIELSDNETKKAGRAPAKDK